MSTLKERMEAALLHRRAMSSPGERVTQRDLANYVGVSAPSVSAWFSGETKSLKGDTALKAAKFLGVRAEWLNSGAGPMLSSSAVPDHGGEVAHSMSLYEITVPPTTKWEDLMTLGEVPERFTVAMPDDALAGFIERGTGLIFERSDRAAPGKTVLVEDKDGNRFIRRYAQVRGDHWRAIATSEVFGSLDSVEHGLKVLAVMKWREG